MKQDSTIRKIFFTDKWFWQDMLIGYCYHLERNHDFMEIQYVHTLHLAYFSFRKKDLGKYYYVKDHASYLYKIKMLDIAYRMEGQDTVYHYLIKDRLDYPKLLANSRYHPIWRKKLDLYYSTRYGILAYDCYNKKRKLVARIKLVAIDDKPFTF